VSQCLGNVLYNERAVTEGRLSKVGSECRNDPFSACAFLLNVHLFQILYVDNLKWSPSVVDYSKPIRLFSQFVMLVLPI